MLNVIKKTPIPAAGVALGLAALGNLIQPISESARLALGVMSFAFAMLVIAKAIAYPAMIREDFKSPILASVSATLCMTLMQLATYLAPALYWLAFAIWCVAIIAHLALMAWFSATFVKSFKLSQVFPTWFICYVGIIVASVTSPAFGMEAIGQVLFWLGFACYIPLLAIITVRYIRHEVPAPARPLFCIYSAPASLSIAGYLAVTPEPSALFVGILLIFAQAFFVLVVVNLPKFVMGGFFPSFAAMTFPFVITATALISSVGMFQEMGFEIPAIAYWAMGAEMVFAAIMVTFVVVRYCIFLIAPAPHPANEVQQAPAAE